MNRFSYQARDQRGEILSGEIDALSVTQAVTELEATGLVVQSIQIVPQVQVDMACKTKLFYENIEKLLASRSEWMPALEALAEELPSIPLRQKFQKMLTPLRSCTSAPEFLATPDAVLLLPICGNRFQDEADAHRIHDWLSSLLHLVQTQIQRRRALVYPMILLALVFSVFILLSYTFFPLLRSAYRDSVFHDPYQPSLVLSLSEQVLLRPVQTIFSLIAISCLAIFTKKLWSHFALTNQLLRDFVAGTSSNLVAMSVLSGTLAELLALKAPLSLSLAIAGKTCRHYFFQQATARLDDSLQVNGQNITTIDQKSLGMRRLPPILIHALTSSPDSQPSVPLLREISMIYSDLVKRRADWFLALVPVLAMLILGVVVFFILFSVVALLTRSNMGIS